jgi:hypothetical protein
MLKEIGQISFRNRINPNIRSPIASLKPLFYPYLYFIQFYSSPYIVDDKLYHTSLVGKVIFKDAKLRDSEEYFDYIRDHIPINVADHIGYGYSSGTALQYEDNHTYVDIIVRGRNFPIDRLQQD